MKKILRFFYKLLDNNFSGVWDSNNIQIRDKDIIKINDGCIWYYWVEYSTKYKKWWFYRQYGETIYESSLCGDLYHCIDNLKYKITVIGKIKNSKCEIN